MPDSTEPTVLRDRGYRLPSGDETVVRDLVVSLLDLEPGADLERFLVLLEAYLGESPWFSRLFVRLAARLIHLYPVLHRGRRWARLDRRERERTLEALEMHRQGAIRAIFMLFKSVVCLVYYADPESLARAGLPPVGSLAPGRIGRLLRVRRGAGAR